MHYSVIASPKTSPRHKDKRSACDDLSQSYSRVTSGLVNSNRSMSANTSFSFRTPKKSLTRNNSHSSVCMGPGATLFYVNPPEEEIEEGIDITSEYGGTYHVHGSKSFKERARAYCTGKHFFGILLIILVAFIWVGASIWIQRVFGEYQYDKPYFLTYFNTTGFCFWNLGFLFSKSWRKVPITDEQCDIDDSDNSDNTDYICTDTRGHREMAVFSSNVNYTVVPSSASCAPTADYVNTGHAQPIEVADTENHVPTKEQHQSRSPICIFKHDVEPNVKTYLTSSLQLLGETTNGSHEVTSASCGICPKASEEDVDGNTTCPHSKLNPSIRENEDKCDLNPESQRENCTIEGPYCNDPSAIEGQESPSFRETDELKPYSLYKIAKGALFFCPLWFLANVLFNYSLANTSVASNTIISTTSSIWTIVLSKLLLNHDICMAHKITAVLFSITGTCLVALNDTVDYHTDSNAHTHIKFNTKNIVGDILALLSAVFYAAYTTVLKWGLPDDDCFRIGMVFGIVGVLNLVLMWPGLIFVDLVGIETFEVPSLSILFVLAANAAIGTNLSDVMWAKSVLLTSPLVATLGLSLTIPIAMVADSILKGKEYSPLYILGAMLVTTGFVIVNLRSG